MGELDGARADGARRAADQDLLSGREAHGVPHRDQRRRTGDDQGGRVGRGESRRCGRVSVRGDDDVLGRPADGVQVPAEPGHPRAVELVGELAVRSDEFAGLWARHDVAETTRGRMRVRHPLVGELNPDWTRTRRRASPAARRPRPGGCVPDIGLLPVGEDAAEAFYRIIDAAYERRSIAVTSNIHPSGFDTIMPKTLAGASTDRLMHHAHLVTTTGDSHRLAEALAGKGVIPLH